MKSTIAITIVIFVSILSVYRYISHIPKSFMGIFADDTKIYRPITSSNDVGILQQDINSLSE